MLKKIMYIIATVIEVLLLIGSYAVDYFTKKKMGMARFVIYKNFQWEEKYPISTLTNIFIGILILLTVIVLLLTIARRKRVKKIVYIMTGTAVILTAWYVWFVLTGSKELRRSYYFVSMLYAGAALIQGLKSLAGVIGGCRRYD